MELIDIIYNILLFGSGLLVLVVMISFVLSKTKTEESISYYQRPSYKSQQINPLQKVNNEQNVLRKNQTIAYPQIFQLENFKPKEIKIVRKATVTNRDSQAALRFDPKHMPRTDGSGTRYTIVNEDLRKRNLKAASFYI